MKLAKKHKEVNKYIIENILQLPATYVLSDYYELVLLWKDLRLTPEMTTQLNLARQKTINADILVKLNEVVSIFNINGTTIDVNHNFRNSILSTIEEAKTCINKDVKKIYELNFEHDIDPNSTYAGILIGDNSFELKTDLDFTPYWGVLISEKWLELEEYFEGIMLSDEEFIHEVGFAFKLQSYMKFYKVLEDLKLFIPGNKILPKGMKIRIGQHDCWNFEFVVK